MDTEFDFNDWMRISNSYFSWLCDVVGVNSNGLCNYRKLMTYLHGIEFRYTIPRDVNRYEDGQELRNSYILLHETNSIRKYLDGPCSVLEMMIALALRLETNVTDGRIGDRTRQWFWGMIVSLGLGPMTDEFYDRKEVSDIMRRFMNHKYAPNGKGGLVTIRGYKGDLRDKEIAFQMYRYIDTII